MHDRILLIEDEIELQQNLKEILEYHGFIVLSADNGKEALIKIKTQQVDLILCDIMMPEMDGFEFLKILRGEERFQRTPFIFLSAKVSEEDKLKGFDSGANDYLSKPISARLLLNAIFGTLEREKERISLCSLKNEKGLDVSPFSRKPENNTLLSGLITVLEHLKTISKSVGRKEESQLVCLALASAQWIHSSFDKLPLFKSIEKSTISPRSINLSDVILDVMNKFGAEKFIFRSRATQHLVFDSEQIKMVIMELLENAVKFNSDPGLIEVEWVGNALSIKNKQSIFGQIEKVPIEAFSMIGGGSQQHRGLGLGLFLCKEYCKMNRAEFHCSVDADGYFNIQIFFQMFINSSFDNVESSQVN